jgi:hypothetical protein
LVNTGLAGVVDLDQPGFDALVCSFKYLCKLGIVVVVVVLGEETATKRSPKKC